ncbi:beta strand repeat-containing protein [Herbaspirillum huttiense]|uniref:Ig-like domain-containing protein n=2 Tax=Herbaspirillum huttiense TaxID=863372 RepID=A0AAJ2LTK5_9BURK|nr:Ig-like domain-containing protein [Herbaspirillum huttiense]MDR9834753.1 Ig-like domain-containing protein [Herbaspirillum huttiense]
MTTTVLKLSEAAEFLKKISIRTIKDVRAMDVDLLFVFANGERIIISGGAMQALSAPDTQLQFADGQLQLGRVFQQIDRINVSPEANLTVSSKEITRYNQNNTKTDKVRKQEDESDKPVIAEDGEKAPQATLATSGDAGNTAAPEFSPLKSPDNQQQLSDVEINSQHEKNWGVQWPVAAGVLALLAAASGGGGGGAAAAGNAANGGGASGAGGAAGGAVAGAGASSQPEIKPTLSGAAMLGPLNNATAIAYDDQGHAISAAAQVIDGHYSLVLNKPGYRGTVLVVISDNTPGLPDNYADEATHKLTDLGNTVLRALVTATGASQTVNVTALTELAVIKAGLDVGMLNPADVPDLSAERIAAINNAVGGFFKVDAIGGEVVPTASQNVNGQVVVNPGFNPGISSEAYNYGAALKAISNLSALDAKAYPTQIDAIQKLAKTLQFVDDSDAALKWATNVRGQSLASSNLMQSHLFSEPLLRIIRDPDSTEEAVAAAQLRYDTLQKLPGGSTVAAYLQQNHVAIAEPTLLIKQAVMSNPELWQSAPLNSTLQLDQGDFLEGGLSVKTPPFAGVNVVLDGKDNLGHDLRINLPAARADATGQAVLVADDDTTQQLLQLDHTQPVVAEVTVSDGYNNRTNYTVWKNNDVRVDLTTPAGMTNFAEPAPALVTDSSYSGRNGDDPLRVPAAQGDRDKITQDGSLRVRLTKALSGDERLQFAVATAADINGQPLFGSWKEAGKLTQGASNARGEVDYIASDVASATGSNWVKARVVQVGASYTGGYGNANTGAETLQFTLDTVAPTRPVLQFLPGKDDGLSGMDGVSSQPGAQLSQAGAMEVATELHFRLVAGNGTDARTLQLLTTSGAAQEVKPDSWYRLKAGERLQFNGDTITGNGKAQIDLRQIDMAGNFSENSQRFVVDSSGLIEHTVLLANSEKAVNEARSAVAVAQAAFDAADALSRSAKQAALATAQAALTRLQTAEDNAMAQARTALVNADGSTRLDSVMATPIDKNYVPAIINAVAATADADKVSDALSLKAVVSAAIKAADAAVAKASVYGDDPANPAPTLADFKAMGVVGVNNAQQLESINDALKALPQAASDSIAQIQNTVNAYYKVQALADGKPGNTDVSAYPTAADYAALGVAPALSVAGARILSGAIDAKTAADVASVAAISDLAQAAQRLAAQAALPAGQTLPDPLKTDDFARLGVTGTSDDNVAEVAASLNSVPQELRANGSIVGEIDTLAEVQALVTGKIGSLQTILNYAKGVNPINPLRPTQMEPDLSDYQSALLNANSATQVTAANLASINSAVKAVGVEPISSWKKLGALVQSYNLVLAAADGVPGNAQQLPAADDYARIGVQALQTMLPAAGAARGNALNLLNQVLDATARSAVDSIDKLQALASVAARVLALGAGQKVALSADELNQLHLATPVTAAQLPVVLSGIAGTADDGAGLRSPAMVSEVAARALAASAKIMAYADDAAQAAPQLADYRALGIHGVDDELHQNALNSALATPAVDGAQASDPGRLQDIADAFGRILGQAAGAGAPHAEPLLKDFALIGAAAPHDENTKGLINSALTGKNPHDLLNVATVSQLVTAANAIGALAAGDDSGLAGNTAADKAADLNAKLGMLGVVNLNDALQASVTQAIVASADDGSGINTLAKLQALVDGAQQAQAKINAYADDASHPAPAVADYAAIGVSGVSADKLEAINSALASTPVTSAQTATPALVQGIVDAYARILAAADGRAGNAAALPQPQDYQRVGLPADVVAALQPDTQGKSAPLLDMLNTLIDVASPASVNTLPALSQVATTAQHLIAQAKGSISDALVTQAELSGAGITGLDAHTFPAVLSAIAASPDDGSGLTGLLPAGGLKLQALADNAAKAQLKIEAYADGVAKAAAPTPADLRSIGLDLAAHMPHASPDLALKALNSVLQTVSIGAAQVNTPAKLAAIADACDLVMAAADGAAPADGAISPAAQAITADVLVKLGVTGLSSADPAVQALLVSNMQSVIDALTPAAAADVSNLQASADVLVKISHLADGIAGNATAADQFSDALAALQAAGINLADATVAKSVASALDGADYAKLASPAKLQAMVDAYARILAEANEAEPAAGAVAGDQDKVPDATPGSDPSLAEFNAIGAHLPGLTVSPGSAAEQDARLKLTDDVLKRKARSQVDTVAEIEQIGQAVDQLLQLAAQPAASVVPVPGDDDRARWQANFRALGVSGVDTGSDGNLELVLARVHAAGLASFTTVAPLQNLVNGVNESLLVIMNYAEDSDRNPAPTVANYHDVGVDRGVGAATVDSSNLASINAAVAKLERGDVDSRAKLKGIVSAYNAILAAADGKSGDASAAALQPEQYLAIGVPLSNTLIGMGKLAGPPGGAKSLEKVDADKLALFNSVVAAQRREGVDTPDKLAALAATASDLIRLAKESKEDPVVGDATNSLSLKSLQALGLGSMTSEAVRSAFLDAVRVKGNNIDPATNLPSSADNGATHDVSGVRSIEQLTAIANSYAKVLAYVNGAGGATEAPQLSDYQTIGVAMPHAVASTANSALALLNSAVHAQSSPGKVDSVAELNRLALTVDQLMQVTAAAPLPDRYPVQYPPVSSTLKPADLSALGLSGVDGNSLAALLNKLQTTADDGSGALTVAALQRMMDAATAAGRKIVQFARDDGGDAPAVADFDALGLQLPVDGSGNSTPYLNAINDALKSASISAAQVQTPDQLQGLIIAAQHVVDAANGIAGDASPKPNAADFLALGLDKSKLDAAGATGVAMLADTVDANTLSSLSTDEAGRAIALPDKLAQLLDLIQSLMVTAAGGVANPPLDPVQLGKLGVNLASVAHNPDGSPQNWSAILAAIAGSKKDGSEVNTLAKLQALVNRADAAQTKIRLYADDAVSATDAATTPSPDDYRSIGLVNPVADANGVRAPLVTADNVGAVNAALRTSAINAAQADTPPHVKQVVDAYLAILARANGVAPDTGAALTPAQFKAIGTAVEGVTAPTGKATDAAAQGLLDGVIGGQQADAVNTPAKINALGVLVNKILLQAQASDDTPRLTVAELAQLGLTSADGSALAAQKPAAIAAALYAIRAGADNGSDVNTFAKLQTVVSTALTAYQKIQTYAELQTVPGGFPEDSGRPTADDFKAMGLNVPASVEADKAIGASATLLTAAFGAAQIDTPAKLQAILDNWDKLFALANGRVDTPALSDTTRAAFSTLLSGVGVTVDAATRPAALDLLQTALDQQASKSVMNTPTKLEGLLATAQGLLTLAGKAQVFAGDRLPTSMAATDLAALGVMPATASNAAAAAVLSAVSAQAASAVDSLAEVQALATQAIKAQAKISAYADDASKPVPGAADYLAIGLVKADGSALVGSDNLGAVNTTLASKAITAALAGDPAKLKGIVDAYAHIVAASLAGGAAPSLEDYAAIGLSGLNLQNKGLLDGALSRLGADKVKDQSQLQKAADAVVKITALADASANTDGSQLPTAADYAALGLNLGHSSAAADPDGSGAALLGSVIDAMPLSGLNSLDKLQALMDAVNKLMDSAARLPGAAAPGVADLQLLGMDMSSRSPAQQGAILAAIGTSGTDGSQIKSLAALSALAQKAVDALAKISAYAQDNTGATLGVPTADDYTAMGVYGVTSSSVAAINAALATTTVDGARASTQPLVQGIASAYLKILAAADGARATPDPIGSAAVPTAAELESIGVGVSAATNSHTISLLATALDALSRDQVATPARIDGVSASAARMIAAAGNASAAAQLTIDDFSNLGVQGLDVAFLANVQALVAGTDVNRIDSSTRLQGLVDGLLKDLKIIRNYADGVVNTDASLGAVNSVLAPTLDNYARAGVSGVSADMLPCINASIKTLASSSLVDSKSKLQAIVDAYQHVLQAADGVAGNLAKPITREELIRIGVSAKRLPDPAAPGLTAADAALAQATLNLLTSALDAQPADKSTVSTPAKIADLAALAGRVAAHAAGSAGATPPTSGELQTLGVKNLMPQADGNTPSTLGLVNSALKAISPEALGSLNLAQIQTITTAAAKLRNLASANSVTADASRPAADAVNADGSPKAGAPLTLDEFRALGMAVDTAPANVKLLNEAFNARPNFASVSDLSKINALNLVDIVNRVMRQADADVKPENAPAGITVAELATLGLNSTGANADVNAASLSAFMAALKTRAPADVDTLAELKSVGSAARAAQAKIMGYAERQSSGAVAQAGSDGITPVAQDFADMGVVGVGKYASATPDRPDAMPEGLFAVLSALATSAVNGTRAATAELVQGIVDSAGKLLGLADGVANTPAAAPAQEDYRLLGADLSGVGRAATKSDYLSLLNSVVDGLKADKVDTPAEVLALADTVALVLDSPAVVGGSAPARTDLERLGVTGLSDKNMPAVLARLQQLPADKLATINTLPGLQALVDKAVAAQDKIRDYADDNTRPMPLAQDYADMGVLLPAAPKAVADSILGATNKALASGPVGADQAGTPDLVQGIVNSYAKLLALADGSIGTAAADLPVAQDYVRVGLDKTLTDKLANPSNLLLLNQLVDDAATPSAVDSPASLSALASVANKVLAIAAQQTGDLVSPADALSAADFKVLGINGLTNVESDAVVAALQSRTLADVDTVAEVQGVANAARAAINRIVAYADSNGGDAPTVADFQTLGVTGVNEVGVNANKDDIIAALATSAVDGPRVSSVAGIQALVDSYARLLAQADGVPSNTGDGNLARQADFERIGVDLSGILALDSGALGASANIVQLLSSIVDSRSTTDVSTPAKISALADLAIKAGLAVQGDNSRPMTAEDFAALKISGVNAGNLAKVQAQLARQADDGSSVNTWAKLADAVFTVTNVPAINTVAGDDIINLAERTAGVTLTGTAGKDDTVTLFYPDGSVIKSGIPTRDSGTGTSVWNWSYTLTAADWQALGADGANGVEKIIGIQSHNTVKGLDSIRVTHGITIDTTPPVFTAPLALASDTGIPGDGITSVGKVLVSGLEAAARWAYKIDGGDYQPGSGGSFTIAGDGAHTVKVRQTDRAGNDSVEQVLTMTLDTAAPAKLSATLARDTGSSGSDRLTSDGTLNVSGVESGATWQYSLDSGVTWSNGSGGSVKIKGAVDGAGNTDGAKKVVVRQTDAAANVGATSDAVSFTLDTTLPAKPALGLAKDSGNTNDRITNEGTVNVSKLETGASWQYSLDNGTTWQDGTATSFRFAGTADGSGGSDGAKNLLVRQTDAAGNVSPNSDKFSFTLDTTAPAAPSLALSVDSGNPTDKITNNATFKVSGIETGATWQYSLDSGTTWSNGSGTSVKLSGLPDGNKTMIVRQIDVAGNVGSSSDAVSITLDTAAPAKPVLSLARDSGSSPTDRTTNDGTVNVAGLEAGGSWQYSLDAGVSWSDGSGASVRVPGAADGNGNVDGLKSVLVRQTDIAGNTGPVSDSFGFTLDSTAPVKLALSLARDTGVINDMITSDGTVNITGLETGATWQYSVDNGINWSRGSGTSFLLGGDGNKNVVARQIDVAGNVGPVSDVFSFVLDGGAPQQPGIALATDSGSSATDNLTNDGTVKVSKLVAGANWQYSLDGGTTWSNGTGNSFKLKGAIDGGTNTDGVRNVVVRQTNAAGNTSPNSDPLSINLDTTAPVKPGLSLLSDNGSSSSDRITNDGTVKLDGLEAGASWEYSTDGGTSWTAGSGSSLKLTGDGNKTVQVRQTDAAGNKGAASDSFSFTLDTSAPAKPVVALATDSGTSPTDRITRDGTVNVTGLEGGARWQYSTDSGTTWSDGSGDSIKFKGTADGTGNTDGAKKVQVRQIDVAGNTGPSSAALSFTLDTTLPAKVNATLAKDNGASASDKITNDGTVNVSGLEAGAIWEYSTDNGTTWTPGSGSSIKLKGAIDGTGNSDGLKSILLRQLDVAGNAGPASDALSFTLDTTVPAKPGLVLATDSGVAGDKITRDGTLDISGLESGATWQYSTDDGANWTLGTGTSVKLSGDGIKKVVVRQTDVAGNNSVKSDAVEFTLDTQAQAPSILLDNPAGKTASGASMTTAGSFSLSGVAEKGAQVVVKRDDGATMGTVTASSTDGAWSLNLSGSLTISGLKKSDGSNSSANGTYSLLSAADQSALLNSFSGEFAASGSAVLDLSKPVYRMGSDAAAWYVWAAQDGGYVISRRSGSDDWYRESTAAGLPAGQPEKVAAWNAIDTTAALLLAEMLQNGDDSDSEVPLSGVSVVSANGTRDIAWGYTAEQTDVAGNVSPKGSLSVMVDTATPPLLDMDALTTGIQTSAQRLSSVSELRAGTPFAANVVPPAKTTVSAIDVVFGGSGLVLANDRLLLDALVALDANLAPVSGKTVGGVPDVSYVYTTATRTLNITKSKGGSFSGAEIEAIVESIKLQNLTPTVGNRVININLRDDAGLVSPATQAILTVGSDALMLDLDPTTAGLQISSGSNLTDAAQLAAGVAFDASVAAPSSTQVVAIKVVLGGAGLDPDNDRLLLDASLALNADLAIAGGKTVGGVAGLSYGYDSASRTLTLRKGDNGNWSGSEVQSVVQAIKLAGNSTHDGLRTAQISLVSASGETGNPSTAGIRFDTHAPVLDVDTSQVDVQTSSFKTLNGAKAVAGEGLFAHDIVVWPTSDISSIAIRMDGPQLNLQHDKLLLDVPLALDASLPAVSGKTVGGVAGLTYGYEGSSHRLTISKSSGAALTGLEARAILKSIQFQTASPSAGDRSASITLTDQAGNSNTVVANLSLDLTRPSSISAALVSSKQVSYKTLNIPDIMGSSNSHNLHSGESADLTSLLPAGMTPASFISSLKGMYAHWGGISITNDANTTDPHFTSVYSFPSGFGMGTTFSMVHQGGPYAKGENFKFTSPDGKQLLLSAVDGFYASNTDVFSYKTPTAPQNYDIGNVRLLYQVTTDNANSQPIIKVSYDGTKASAGDVIGLYEGDKLLGSRILTAADVGAAGMTLEVSSAASLSAGEHVIQTRFSDAAGNVVVGNEVRVTLPAGAVAPVLGNLQVNGETPATQPINASATKYAMIAETPTSAATLTGLDQNLTFSGTVGGAGAKDTYLISVSMGGKVIAFGEVKAGDFSLTTPANLLAPGMYHDLTITATNTSAGVNNGQTTVVQNQALGWYWVPQKLESLTGGAGDDQIQLSVTAAGANTVVQTGLGKDTLVLGGFGTSDSSKLVATVSDFTLGQDKVAVFAQTITKDNLSSFVQASSYNTSSTKLVVDLDGAGSGNTVYTLYLQNVAYNPGNTHTIFGV